MARQHQRGVLATCHPAPLSCSRPPPHFGCRVSRLFSLRFSFLLPHPRVRLTAPVPRVLLALWVRFQQLRNLAYIDDGSVQADGTRRVGFGGSLALGLLDPCLVATAEGFDALDLNLDLRLQCAESSIEEQLTGERMAGAVKQR